jgi:hypothetical protein
MTTISKSLKIHQNLEHFSYFFINVFETPYKYKNDFQKNQNFPTPFSLKAGYENSENSGETFALLILTYLRGKKQGCRKVKLSNIHGDFV